MSMIGNYLSLPDKELRAILSGGESILDFEERSPENTLDIDKSWQAILYLLCDDIADGEPPMGYVVPMMEENAIESEQDFMAFYLTAAQVQEANDYLEALTEEEILEKYDFEAMKEDEVYPIWDDDEADAFFEYIHPYLLDLREFYKNAADKNHAVIFYVM